VLSTRSIELMQIEISSFDIYTRQSSISTLSNMTCLYAMSVQAAKSPLAP